MPLTSSLMFIKMYSVLIVTSLDLNSWGLYVSNNNDIAEYKGLDWNTLSCNGLSLANHRGQMSFFMYLYICNGTNSAVIKI